MVKYAIVYVFPYLFPYLFPEFPYLFRLVDLGLAEGWQIQLGSFLGNGKPYERNLFLRL